MTPDEQERPPFVPHPGPDDGRDWRLPPTGPVAEQLRIAVQAASDYSRRRNELQRRDARIPYYPMVSDWKAPDMGHILAALRALGLLPKSEGHATDLEIAEKRLHGRIDSITTTHTAYKMGFEEGKLAERERHALEEPKPKPEPPDDGRDWRTIDFDGDAYPAFDVVEKLQKLGYKVVPK